MGAISFLLYNMSNPPINIEFTKSFMNMKRRGQSDTQVKTESTPIFNQTNITQINSYLSKREIAEYKPLTFQYGYHRMSINDPTIDGSQPFDDPILHKVQFYPELRIRPKRKLLCNGEIYNYNELIETHDFSDRDLQSESDVEVIMPLYIKSAELEKDSEAGLIKCLGELNGDYSFILTENTNTFHLKQINVFAVRDPFGTRPLYMIKYKPSNQIKINKDEIFYLFVSELKGIPVQLLNDPDYIITEVPPGTFWSYKNSVIDKNDIEFIRYNDFSLYKDLNNCSLKRADPDTLTNIYKNIKDLLTKSVIDRYNLSHQSVGVLMSGGFDSCIIFSILIKYLVSIQNDFVQNPIHVFTIGDDSNEDVINAKNHVLSLETLYKIDIHHHIVNVQNSSILISEVENTIRLLETYDRNTIRKSIPLVFLLDYIKNTNVKVLLSGDGLDEICGYNQLFELTDQDFQNKSIDLLNNLNKYDLLRCDKLAESFGLEMRFPFLDITFVKYMLSIHPLLKRPQVSVYSKTPIEKYIVRKSFESFELELSETNFDNFYIKNELLWNHRKDISRSFDVFRQDLTDYYNNMYNDIDYQNYVNNITDSPPTSKEEMHYRKVFEKMYPYMTHILPEYWHKIMESKK